LAHDNDTGDIFFLSRSEEIFYFRFRLRHFEIRGPLMSDDVGSVTTSSGVVENLGIAVGISLISHSVPENILLPVWCPP
jgi:hypothetical protein